MKNRINNRIFALFLSSYVVAGCSAAILLIKKDRSWLKDESIRSNLEAINHYEKAVSKAKLNGSQENIKRLIDNYEKREREKLKNESLWIKISRKFSNDE